MAMGQNSAAGGRAADLDLFKTLLVIGMIFAHVVQLADLSPGRAEQDLALYANLVTFSGFMLAFGLGVGRAGVSARKTSGAKISAPLKLYAAYAVSSFAFILLVERHGVGAKEVADVLLMRRLHGYSEFLASFFLLSPLTTFFRPQVIAFGQRAWAPLFAGLVSLAACLLAPTALEWPLIGAAFGSLSFPTFPLPQYGFWFALGIYVARGGRAMAPAPWLLAGAATLAFCLAWHANGALPMRFPPSPFWVAGAALPLLFTVWLARAATERLSFPAWAMSPGRHVLFFLMASNLALFANRYVNGKSVMDLPLAIGAALLLIGAIIIARLGWDDAARRLTRNPGNRQT